MPHDEPLAVLRAFFQAMSNYERDLYALITTGWDGIKDADIEAEHERRKEASRANLEAIFEQYVETGRNGKRLRDAGQHCGGPEPDYNPATEAILSTKEMDGCVTVETQMAHNFQFRFRYQLVKVADRWLIKDNRVALSKHRKGWKPVPL